MEKRREAKNSLSLLFSAGSSSLSLSLSLSLNFSLSRQNTLSLRPCARVVLLPFLYVKKGERERKEFFASFLLLGFGRPLFFSRFFFQMRFLFFFLSIIFLHKRAQKTALCARFLPLATHERRGENTRFFARVNNERERETLFGVDFVRLFLFSREREREFFLER